MLVNGNFRGLVLKGILAPVSTIEQMASHFIGALLYEMEISIQTLMEHIVWGHTGMDLNYKIRDSNNIQL